MRAGGRKRRRNTLGAGTHCRRARPRPMRERWDRLAWTWEALPTGDAMPDSLPAPSRRSLARARRFAAGLGTFEEVFSLQDLVASAVACNRGVGWKREAQSFHLSLVQNCARLRGELLGGTCRLTPGKRFAICERGKPRGILSRAFRDRVVQRTLCDRALVPAVESMQIGNTLFGSSICKEYRRSTPGSHYDAGAPQSRKIAV